MTRPYRVEYLPAAQDDLAGILDYIARDDARAAHRLVDRTDRAIGHLATSPRAGREPRDARLRRLGYRVLIVGDHLVFYVVIRRIVQIRRVLHGARRYDFLFEVQD